MASIRKRGNSYLIVVSMGYDYKVARIKSRQKTVHPPQELTPKQREKWLQEQAVLFERSCRDTPEETTKPITLAAYIDLWLQEVAPPQAGQVHHPPGPAGHRSYPPCPGPLQAHGAAAGILPGFLRPAP